MRKPSEYIAAAVRNIREKQMPDCASTMTHGYRTAKVTRVGSPKLGEDEATESAPAEAMRVLAQFQDFPEVKKGEAVELDGELRVVTSASTDPAHAHLNVGLSASFDAQAATYTGLRREDGQARTINDGLGVLILESGTADNFTDAIAPTYSTAYIVAIRREDWRDATDPEVADKIEIAPDGIGVELKVSAVTRHDGWYILKCRSKD